MNDTRTIVMLLVPVLLFFLWQLWGTVGRFANQHGGRPIARVTFIVLLAACIALAVWLMNP